MGLLHPSLTSRIPSPAISKISCSNQSLQTLISHIIIMHFFTLLAASITAVSASPIASPQTADASCQDVHIFLSKGWNEPYPGRQGALAGSICYGLPSCGYEDILYYNANGSDFCAAVSEGAANGIAQMEAYTAKCPSSKLVLSGYSQGAFIVANMLGGGGGDFSGNCTVAENAPLDIDAGAGKQLAVAMNFGDVQHTGGQSYNVLSGAPYDSNDARTGDRLASMNRFAGVLRSYCDIADPICAAKGPGPFDIEKHLDYFELYTQDAAVWAKGKLGY